MLKKLRLFLGISILFIGTFCSDYVQAKETTVKSSLESALEDEKTKSFLEKNQKKLNQLRKEYDQIQIMIEGTGEIPFLINKDKESSGVYPQLVDLFSSLTKIPCVVEETKESLEDNYNGITNREVDLVLGITLPKHIASGKKTINEMNTEGLQLSELRGQVFENALILAVPLDQNYKKEQLSYAFWGVTLEYDSTVMETMLANHTIEYNTYIELKEAFDQNEIQGMFIPESKLNYEIQMNQEALHGLEFSRVNANEYFVSLRTSNLLSETFEQIAALYDELYMEYFQNDHNWVQKESNNNSLEQTKVVKLIGSIGLLLTVVGALIVIAMQQYSKRQFEKMLEKVPKNDSKREDILFVNLKNRKVQSNSGFSFYGLSGLSHRKKLPMEDMTHRIGFDFTKYYEYIVSRQKTEFVHEFELYIQGVQYHYVETGVVQGSKIVSRIYRK